MLLLQTLLLLLFPIPAVGVWSESIASLLATHEPTATFTTTTPIIPFSGYNLYYAVDTANQHITFAVEATTTGWIGLGIAEAAGMKGADIMMGHVAQDGKAVVGDYHSVLVGGIPNKDGCQDWSALYGEEKDGKTLLVFSRVFKTNDSNDHEILVNSIKRTDWLCAHGANGDDGGTSGTAYNMHASGKNVMQTLDLSNGQKQTIASWAADKMADSDITHIDLRAAGGEYPTGTTTGATGKAAGGKMGPSIGGYPMPADRTTYMEFCYPLSVNSGWNRANKNMVAFQGVHGGTTAPSNIHHTVLYAYSGDDCSGTQEIIWVGGTTFYEDLPSDTGISFSRYQSFMVQTHYDNPTQPPVSGLLDDSGVRIYLSSTAPTHQAGTLQLGDGTLQLAQHSGDGTGNPVHIPVGRSYWTWSCNATGLSNLFPVGLDEITVFASILHVRALRFVSNVLIPCIDMYAGLTLFPTVFHLLH